jgi:glycerol-3-phosphate dehydrogenase
VSLRDTNVAKLGEGVHDVLVVGGGINGAVSAAALAARGARMALVDRGDFAGGTSQQSSNLAWGGIKYLESFEFALVRKLCSARNRLIRAYPSTVQEIRFFTKHARGFRHSLLKLFLGTLLYWFIGAFFTRAPRWLTLAAIRREEPAVRLDDADGGFEYSDAFLYDNDARFVWTFVRSALDRGCVAANYVESLGAERREGLWQVRARDLESGREFTVRAKVLVNAAGPWADDHNGRAGQRTATRHVFSKGIHLIVDRLTKHKRVLTFFADDGRLFFVIPMGRRTCIGTTDTRVDKPEVSVSAEDRRFVLDNINKRLALAKPLTEADVIAERCGVRPLAVAAAANGKAQDFLQLSRKHVVEADAASAHVAIFGGKLTDCLNVGDEICAEVESLGVALPFRAARWYGEAPAGVRDEFFHQARLMRLDEMTAGYASEKLSTRLWRRYGAQALAMLEAIRADPRQAEILIEGTEYTRCEIEQAARREMIVRLEDFLRRRSKIALVERKEDLARSRGLREACRILFGEDADRRFEEHFGAAAPAAAVAARAG